MVRLLCTVRGCASELRDEGTALRCARGHAYDCARSGYVNLLQPNDRRSATPGDSKEAAAARRRFLATGSEEPILGALVAAAASAGAAPGRAALDVGCGEGTFAGRLAAATGAACCGLDISVAAIDLAARAWPDNAWVVANADRMVPLADGSVDVVTSITSRRNAPEMRRVVASDGALLVVVPAPDDLVELRELIHGRRVERDRVERTVAELDAYFALRSHERIRTVVRLDPASVVDLLTTTYRGARASERDRLGEIGSLDVTLARDLLRFAPR
jgi:23S rRNA (guanine745-N1)-methyltransferase